LFPHSGASGTVVGGEQFRGMNEVNGFDLLFFFFFFNRLLEARFFDTPAPIVLPSGVMFLFLPCDQSDCTICFKLKR
jgi:hypothetical protein